MKWLDVLLLALLALGVAHLVIALWRKSRHQANTQYWNRLTLLLMVGAVIAGGGWQVYQRADMSRSAAPSASRLSATLVPEAAAPVILAAGDIASCESRGDEATARLLDEHEGLVFAVGDTVYEDGTLEEYEDCYEPTWGRHLGRTRAVPGNHEYHTPGAEGYFTYFGAAAGEPGKGYYSFDLGEWHIIALNSVCSHLWTKSPQGRWLDGCSAGSAQEEWLRADLAAHPGACTLVVVHDPRYSSGSGIDNTVLPFWQAMYQAGVDVTISGDAHQYERFAPLDPWGNRDDERGITQFVVGTGGRSLQQFHDILPHSLRRGTAYGLLELTLHSTWYEWRFIPVSGQRFTDQGQAFCHD